MIQGAYPPEPFWNDMGQRTRYNRVVGGPDEVNKAVRLGLGHGAVFIKVMDGRCVSGGLDPLEIILETVVGRGAERVLFLLIASLRLASLPGG